MTRLQHANDEVFTPSEVGLMRDTEFFHAKARIMAKVRQQLEATHAALKRELTGVDLLAPSDLDLGKHQFVKGENLDAFPYQYVDFPKHFTGDEKFTFRTLFWWGHHFVFAMVLEGKDLLQYKRNLINRYREIAEREIHISLAPTLWEWRSGTGYTLPLTADRKPEVGAVLSGRTAFKLVRFLPCDDPAVASGRVPAIACEALRAILPVIRP